MIPMRPEMILQNFSRIGIGGFNRVYTIVEALRVYGSIPILHKAPEGQEKLIEERNFYLL